MVPPCLWLAPRGRRWWVVLLSGGVGDFKWFIGWIFKWGWSGEAFKIEENAHLEWWDMIQEPLEESFISLYNSMAVLWAKTALSERYASLQFLWMILTDNGLFREIGRWSRFWIISCQFQSCAFSIFNSSSILFLSTDVYRIIYIILECFLQ